MSGSQDQVRAVQLLFVRNASAVRGFVLGLLPDLNKAEDVLQEVFLTVTLKAEDFRPGSDFLAWARTVARVKVLQHFDRDHRAPRPLAPDVISALEAAAPDLDETRGTRQAALRACLGQVAPKAREIMGLRYDRGLAPAEIARRVSWSSVDAVHVALARVRKFLRECAQRRLGPEGT